MYKNVKIAILSRTLVSFSYGYVIVILPLYLYYLGYSAIVIGASLFAAMLINSFLTFVLGMVADHFGRKYVLALLFLIFSISSLLFLWVNNIYLITLFAGLAGFTAGSTGGPIGSGGAFGAVQNAIISEEVDKKSLSKILGYAAIIEMVAAMGGSFFLSIIKLMNINVYYLFYFSSILGIVSFILSLFLKDYGIRSRKLLPSISYKNIFKLSIPTIPCGLGSGMLLPLLSLWLKVRYNTSASETGFLFGIVDIGVVISLIFMPRLSSIIGRLKLIVLSRAIASITLILIAFSSTFILAGIFLIIRGSFAMGAVPVRQSFVMTNVHDTERATTNGATSLSRNSASAFGPLFSGYLISGDLSFIPLIGGIITMFDPILYFLMFREKWKEK